VINVERSWDAPPAIKLITLKDAQQPELHTWIERAAHRAGPEGDRARLRGPHSAA